MPSLSDGQAGFAGALLDGSQSVPASVRSPYRAAPAKRFNVYRNTICANLTGVLESRFPAVVRLVGEEFFRAMAREFIERYPPVSPVLMRYGGDFADFLDGFEPAGSLPYMGDAARLEWAWAQAYHAADAAALDQEVLQRVPPEQAEHLVFKLHPSVAVVRSQWPIVTIWNVNIQDSEPEPIDPGAGGEDALVLRPALEVLVHRLPAGGGVFIEALGAGRTLGEAAAAGLEASETFNLQGNLTGLLQSGGIIAIHPAAGNPGTS